MKPTPPNPPLPPASTARSPARRRLLIGAACAVAAGTGGVWWARAANGAGPFASLDGAYRTLDEVHRSGARTTEGWDLASVLHHAAQSIEYSMQGFPALKPAWFRGAVGPAAFSAFGVLGGMRHSLTEPIPGAPEIEAGQPLQPAAERAVRALQAFERFDGPLAPHFAYGELDKAQYLRAHLFHLADHWRRVKTA